MRAAELKSSRGACVCVCVMGQLTRMKHVPDLLVSSSRGATHSLVFFFFILFIFSSHFFARGHIDSSRAVCSDMTAGDVWAQATGPLDGLVGRGGK